METLANRLRSVRRGVGVSLRRAATLIREAGFPVSHDAVHKYERGRKVPALYVRAFSEAFGCRPQWLLSGDGPPLDDSWHPPGGGSGSDPESRVWTSVEPDLLEATMERWAERARKAWNQFQEEQDAEGDEVAGRLRPRIRTSWERSRAAGVDPTGAPAPPRLPPDELEARLRRHSSLIEAAAPHLDWLTSLHPDLDHVVYLTCPEGVVLKSRCRPSGLAEEWALLPGYDWSEAVGGTNGAGTALETGEPTAVIGPEHYVEAYRGCTCVAAPVVGPDSSIVGAVDLSTTLECGDPRRLAVVAYVVENIGRELRNRTG